MYEGEKGRLIEVKKFLGLDFIKHKEFRDITDLASQLCDKPISLITLLDEEVNWIKVSTGVNIDASPRETSFCQYGIQQDDVLVIPDATKDSRFNNNPLVHGSPGLRFYAGAPLILTSGFRLGTLCLFDTKPNEITNLQKKTLIVLAKQVTLLLEAELGRKQMLVHIKEIEAKNDALRAIAQMQSHEIRHPLTTIIGLVNLLRDNIMKPDEEWINMITTATETLDSRIHSIVNESLGYKDQKLLRYNKMVEEIEDYAILLIDENGNIENWNKGAEKIKGYKADEIVGKNFDIFYMPEDREKKLPERLLAKAKKEGIVRDEGWRLRKDGTKFWARVVITAIHNDEHEIIGFTKVTRDLGYTLY